MKLLATLALVGACVLLAACAGNPVCKLSHGSNPFVGRPMNSKPDTIAYNAFGCGLRHRLETGEGVIQFDATGGLQQTFFDGQSIGFATEFEVSHEWKRRN